jgi:UDP-glucose 4-epimerase
MVEQMLRWYEHAHGLQWVALRYFNVAGVEPGSGLGEYAEKSTRVIPRAIHSALGSGDSFQVFGSGHMTPDGTAVRDYVHVSDVAAANLLAMRHLESNRPSAVMNIGSGAGVSVRQILDEVGRAVGHPVAMVNSPPRPGDPACVVAATERARQIIGWRPVHSTLREIVESALAWQRSPDRK